MDNIWEYHYNRWFYDKIDTPKELTGLTPQSEPQILMNRLLPFIKSSGYATEESAGFDIPLQYTVKLDPNTPLCVDLGFGMAIPKGYVGLIFPRSGKGSKSGYHPRNLVCVIDSDYRGNVGLTISVDGKGELVITKSDGSYHIATTPEEQQALIEQRYYAMTDGENIFHKTLERGTSLVQCLIMPVCQAQLEYLSDEEELPETDRGTGGHGHSGD